MSESLLNPIPQQSRLVQALIKVARGVAEDVIQRAKMTHTPVILADEEGHILSLEPEELATQLKNY
jgi:transcriptional regulator of acetoin/glycerol metabolism